MHLHTMYQCRLCRFTALLCLLSGISFFHGSRSELTIFRVSLLGLAKVGQWHQYDGKGHPVGAGCKVHVTVVAFGYPSQDMGSVSAKYHEKSEEGKAMKLEVDSSSRIMAKLLVNFPDILPSCDVHYEKTHEVEMYYECGFVIESDLTRHLGYSSKQLKLPKPVQLMGEDGLGKISGWYISLSGMPPDMKDSIRHVKVSTTLKCVRNDYVMTEKTQCRQDQAGEVYALALEKQVANRNPPERCAGRVHLTTVQSLMEKVGKLAAAEAWPGIHHEVKY